MKLSDLLMVLVCDKVKIYNDSSVWCSGLMTVTEARNLPNTDKLLVQSVWISVYGYLVIDCEVA